MSLAPGTRLGPYEIVSLLGAGGMGEVFRARDTKLNREVAIKVLPEEVFEDADRRARFEREAQLLAALNHPNIAAIHAFEEVPGPPARHLLVMELLEGETLRQALAGAKVATRKALEWARQMAQALAAAHEKGIVHRDLKPENVFVTRDGRIKVLDFGLAKATEKEGSEVTNLPTASHGTAPGVVMGTLGYMSPEQVKGKPADARSDIFSFGAILYEMLSGQRAFHRETAAETISAILKEDPPDLSVTNQSVPPGLERLVAHCLEKSPEQRFHSAHDLAFDLESLATASGIRSGAAAASSRSLRPGKTAGALLFATAGLLVGAFVSRLAFAPKTPSPPDFQVLTYSGSDSQPAASPDGRTIAFRSVRDGKARIWVKQLPGGAEAVLTEGPDSNPRFSPDGSTLLFVRGDRPLDSAIYRVPVVGGEARRIAGPATIADWAPDGREIAYARTEFKEGKITAFAYRVAADGTNEKLVGKVEGRTIYGLRWSPDGAWLAVGENPGTGTAPPRLALFPLDGKPPRFFDAPEEGSLRAFAWTANGRLVVVAGSVLGSNAGAAVGSRTMNVRLKEVPSGRSRALFSGIDFRGGLDVVGSGALVIGTGGPRANLRELAIGATGDAGRWLTRGSSVDRQPVYAPDGEWVAFSSNRSGRSAVWEVSTKTGAVRRLTDSSGEDFDPAFTRDGKHLLFSSSRSGHFEAWMADRDGSGARMISNDGADAENPGATPDGKWIVYASGNPEKRGIWKIRADGANATLLAAGALFLPEISPDGTLVSYLETTGPLTLLHVVRLADGAPVPVPLPIPGGRANTGRHRWLPSGAAFAIELENAAGQPGIVVQEYVAGKETAGSRRAITGFVPDTWPESLGVSPDGARLVVSEHEESAALLLVEGVDGVVGRGAKP